ncbi:MAG TPA: response regulator [Bacteroidota bacterium]|nr:response regulator [Bacteroidota bacterium]
MNILIAEDDAPSRLVLIERLRKLGHEVRAAENGCEAWELFTKAPPQVVITDWMMPGMDGLELTRKIREHARLGYTYVIILTALDSKVGYFEGMSSGADDFVTKPCEIVDLNMRLRVAERILSLQSEVEQLEGLLSICPQCKRIRDDQGHWHSVESYLMERTDAQVSHGICPECFRTIVRPEVDGLKKGTEQT